MAPHPGRGLEVVLCQHRVNAALVRHQQLVAGGEGPLGGGLVRGVEPVPGAEALVVPPLGLGAGLAVCHDVYTVRCCTRLII